MKPDDIRSVVLQQLCAIAPEIKPDQIQFQVNLRDQLDLDSVDLLNFVIGLHKHFRIEIPEKDYAQLMTIDGCVSYIRSKLPGASS